MELQAVFSNKLAGKLMARGFVLISLGVKPEQGTNVYYFKKSDNLIEAIKDCK